MKIKNVEQYVLSVLATNDRARNDDFILFGAVMKKIGIDLNMSLGEFLANAKANDVPSFETITRCRRKLTEKNKELSGNVDARLEKTRDFINYALERGAV